jgi:hypothetical protein
MASTLVNSVKGKKGLGNANNGQPLPGLGVDDDDEDGGTGEGDADVVDDDGAAEMGRLVEVAVVSGSEDVVVVAPSIIGKVDKVKNEVVNESGIMVPSSAIFTSPLSLLPPSDAAAVIALANDAASGFNSRVDDDSGRMGVRGGEGGGESDFSHENGSIANVDTSVVVVVIKDDVVLVVVVIDFDRGTFEGGVIGGDGRATVAAA